MNANADVVHQAYRAFASGDIPALLDLVDDEVAWSAPETLPQGGVFTGKGGAVKFFEGLGAAWETLQVDTEALGEISADLVVAVVRGSGLLRGAGPGTYGAAHVFTVRNGKITRFREYVDLDGPLGQP